MTDQSDTLQQTDHVHDIAAERTTDEGHISVDTFFVVGKEYMASPSPIPFVSAPVSTKDTTETLHATGSVANLTTLDDQDISVDPMAEVIIPDVDSTEVNEEGTDIIISEQERIEQERL